MKYFEILEQKYIQLILCGWEKDNEHTKIETEY